MFIETKKQLIPKLRRSGIWHISLLRRLLKKSASTDRFLNCAVALARRSSGLRDRRRGQQANDPFTIDDDG
jgi:hypothetical protein